MNDENAQVGPKERAFWRGHGYSARAHVAYYSHMASWCAFATPTHYCKMFTLTHLYTPNADHAIIHINQAVNLLGCVFWLGVEANEAKTLDLYRNV